MTGSASVLMPADTNAGCTLRAAPSRRARQAQRRGNLLVRIPVVPMTVLARFFDLLTDFENLFRISGIGGFERRQAGFVQSLRAVSPPGDVFVDEHLHLGGFQFYPRRFRLLAGPRHVTARDDQKVRSFEELDRAVPDLCPIVIRFL